MRLAAVHFGAFEDQALAVFTPRFAEEAANLFT